MAAKLKRAMVPSIDGKAPTMGKDVEILKFGLHRYGTLGPGGTGFFPKPTAGYNPIYNDKTEDAVRTLQKLERGAGNLEIKVVNGKVADQGTWNVVWTYLDKYRRAQYVAFVPPKPPPVVPQLGPIYSGGKSLLLHQLTHNTDGIPGYPAFDDGWVAGRTIIAPEPMVVTKDSGSAGGDAAYFRGLSKLEYWIGHMLYAPAVGRHFDKGEKISVIANISWSDGGPHVHTGINAVPLTGKPLKYGRDGNGPDYTFGSAAVGVQLKEMLS